VNQEKIKKMKPKQTPEQILQTWIDTERAEIAHQVLVTDAINSANILIEEHKPFEARRIAARLAMSTTL